MVRTYYAMWDVVGGLTFDDQYFRSVAALCRQSITGLAGKRLPRMFTFFSGFFLIIPFTPMLKSVTMANNRFPQSIGRSHRIDRSRPACGFRQG